MSANLPDAVRRWHDGGAQRRVLDRQVFVRDTGGTGGEGVPIVLVHGFPGSSHDWADVVRLLAAHRRVIALDLPGYGASDKTPTASYSLFRQADIVEALLRDLGVDSCALVAHDMGDTVIAELLARRQHGRLGFTVEHVVLTNGSIFIDQAVLTRGQRLTLRLPARALPISLPTVILRRSLEESFAPGALAPPGVVDAMIATIRHLGGDRLLPVLIRYIEERRRHQARWTEALVTYDGPLTLLWGEQDPIAIVEMAHRLAELRPTTTVRTFPELGHWPSIEAPEVLAAAILQDLEAAGTR